MNVKKKKFCLIKTWFDCAHIPEAKYDVHMDTKKFTSSKKPLYHFVIINDSLEAVYVCFKIAVITLYTIDPQNLKYVSKTDIKG